MTRWFPAALLGAVVLLGVPGDAVAQPRSGAAPPRLRIVGDTTEMAFVLCGFIAFFALVGWLARLIADHRRWLRAARTQSEAHSKLLDRLTSNEELLAYIQTPAARHFLESAPMPLDAA